MTNDVAQPQNTMNDTLPTLTDEQLEALQSNLNEALTNMIGETFITVQSANPGSHSYDITLNLDVKTLAKLISK